jgi:PAT family beta-lactamase induction signal transducer AmpG
VPDTSAATPTTRNPWWWIPTLYFAEGIPYALVTTVSISLYIDLGISNDRITFLTSLLAMPWVLKPLWSPAVDILRTRRSWIWTMQLLSAGAFAAVALVLSGRNVLGWSVMLFLLAAFSSATHDIGADGFYILANSESEQSFFSGVRNTFYRLATLCAIGPMLYLAGTIRKQTGDVVHGWQIAFAIAAGVTLVLGSYHFLILPKPPNDQPGDVRSTAKFFSDFFGAFKSFFQKPQIGVMILFLLFYRFSEAQLMKLVQPFLRASREKGGLGLLTEDVGLAYGEIGITALLVGGIIGGVLVSRRGLRAWLWPMVIVMHLPDAVFIYLSQAQPHNLKIISACIALEQFGYGFGFTAYMLYMIYIARGQHSTAHYAICTGFMALGLQVPGAWSGRLQQLLGYQHFFIWVMLATIPGFIVTALIPLDPEFGKKKQ